MANFYKRFLPSAVAVLKLLTDALRGCARQKLGWTSDMNTAFCATKKLLAQAVELAHPDPRAQLVMVCDASDSHVGGVLQQKDTRVAMRPLVFFSVKLDKAQVKYSTFD